MISIKKIILFFCLSASFSTFSQIIFQENFNTAQPDSSWMVSAKTEQALWLSEDNSKYVRFHPNFQNQFIQTPNINIPSGNYYLLFDWNEARQQAQDSVNVQLSKDNGTSWQIIYSIYNGNNRIWQTDSILLDNINGNIKIRWTYFSSGIFPAQYFNLDNVSIVKNISTSIKNKTNTINVTLFPNPTSDYLQIQLKNPSLKNGIITIYNTIGKIMWQKNTTAILQTMYQIDVSNFTKDAYIIHFQFGEEQFSKTLLVQ